MDLVLIPACLDNEKLIEEFLKDCDLDELQGLCGRHKYDTTHDWLLDKPWSDTGLQMFSYSIRNDRIVGCVHIRPYMTANLVNHNGFNYGHSVHPEFRGMGYGSGQMRLALQYFNNMGISSILVAANCTNLPSCQCIEACGGVRLYTRNEVYVYMVHTGK